jgi:hypothetical protein
VQLLNEWAHDNRHHNSTPKEQFDIVVEAAGDAGALVFGVDSCAPAD